MPCKVLAVQLGTAVLSHIHPASCSAVRLSPLSNHCRIELPRQQRRCASIVRASTQVSLRAFTKNRSVCTYLWQCTSTLQGSTPDSWVAANAERLRSLPLVAGASGIIGVLLNRLLSGVAPVVDASSSQSRTDVLVILLSAVLLLTGLQWLALQPKVKPSVQLDGQEVAFIQPGLPEEAQQELEWAWQSLRDCSTCQAVVVIYHSSCLMHMGVAKPGHNPPEALLGPICRRAMSSERGNYLANLALYPGRVEFTSFLPQNTQAAIIQPIGSEGVLIAASNTQRGFTRLDQAWASTIADKLETSLAPIVQLSTSDMVNKTVL
ncbi:hypothetical protein ABBQ38_008980 [Trebouxia sp. C0009 RCD-2024]